MTFFLVFRQVFQLYFIILSSSSLATAQQEGAVTVSPDTAQQAQTGVGVGSGQGTKTTRKGSQPGDVMSVTHCYSVVLSTLITTSDEQETTRNYR